MHKTLIAATFALAGLFFVGCQARPTSVRQVDQSVLPAQAKALLSSDATIDSVDEETYTKGTKIYVIHYTMDGQPKVIKWNSKEDSTPTGVFEYTR